MGGNIQMVGSSGGRTRGLNRGEREQMTISVLNEREW